MQVLCTLRWKVIREALLRWHLGRLLLHWCRLQSKRTDTCIRIFFWDKGLVCMVCFLFKKKKIIQHLQTMQYLAVIASAFLLSVVLQALLKFSPFGLHVIIVILVVPGQAPPVLMVPPPCSHSLSPPSISKRRLKLITVSSILSCVRMVEFCWMGLWKLESLDLPMGSGGR